MISCMKINIKAFYKLIVSFLLVIATYGQSIENTRFVMFII